MKKPKKEHPTLQVSREGKTLVLEWDNRIERSRFKVFFSSLVGSAVTIYFVILAVGAFVLAIAGELYPVLLSAPFLLMFGSLTLFFGKNRAIANSRERIEIDNEEFRHLYLDMPKYLSNIWPTESVSEISIDVRDRLQVRRGRRIDEIGTWTKSGLKSLLYRELESHLRNIGSQIKVVRR